MKVVFPNRFVRYDLIRCIALASFVHTSSGLSTAVWPETYDFETEPLPVAESTLASVFGTRIDANRIQPCPNASVAAHPSQHPRAGKGAPL